MAGSSIFVTYGLKSGGGLAFLKRTRTVFSQLQTRTRSQTGTWCRYIWTNAFYSPWYICQFNNGSSETCWGCGCSSDGQTALIYQYWGASHCNYERYMATCRCSPTYSAYGDWSDTTSCSGSVTRQCATNYIFREQDWTAYEEVDLCESASPDAGLNAVEVECIPQ